MKIETMNISLPTSLKAYVQQRVKRDGYGNVSEYVRELIRDDQEKKVQQQMDQLLLEGLEGPTTPLTKDDWAKLRRDLKKQAAQLSTASMLKSK